MSKKRLSPKSMIFYKLYLVNILITVVFICMISFMCSVFSSRLILNNMIEFNKELLVEKSNALDERVKQLDETVNLMLGEENVFKLLMTNEPYYEKPTGLLKIIRHFQNVCTNNSLVKSVCLVDVKRGIAITDKTKMNIAGPAECENYQRQNSFVISDTEKGKQLEFVKIFEPVRGEKNVYIILTLDEKAFTDNLLMGNGTQMMKSYLLTNAGDMLSVSGADEIDENVRERLWNQKEGIEKIQAGEKKLVLYKNQSQISDISLAAVQDYTYLTKAAGEVNRMIIMASVLMIAVATVIIYLCSLYAYQPLKRLGYKLQGLVLRNEPEKVTNEYHLIEDVVTELQNEKEYALPSVVRDSVQRLVTDYFDVERFEYLKRMLHQDMNYELNVLVITECESLEKKELLVQSFRDFIKNTDGIDGFFAGITATRGIGIFNTALGYEAFLKRIQELKEQLDSAHGIPMTCCVSGGFKNWENLNLIYSETLRNLERRFFKGKNTLIYEAAPVQDYKIEYYSGEIENRLTKYVTEGLGEEALDTLDTLTRDLRDNTPDIQYTRFVYFQICNNLIRNVLELGGRLPKDYQEKNIFEKMFGAESIQELEKIAEQILRVCMSNFKHRDSAYSSNVEKAISFISTNYMRDISLDDVANEVFLSSGYLSIIFKEETGYTVMEYLTHIRMKRAKELVLTTPALKVKDIAEQLGYNNVQSFIRYFKKYYGETPMAFRKKEDQDIE